MKRACVFFFFDKDGVVDRYIPYYIRELHKVADYIVVVVNGKLTPEGRTTLVEASDDLFVRDNTGFDAWAYKDGIDFIGWEEMKAYDELILANFTMFGPIYPLDEMFDRMEQDPCDFWGLFKSYQNLNMKKWGPVPLKWGYRPEALASSFLVFKTKVLRCYEFARHWNNLRVIRSYYESGVYNEMELSQMLRDAGFVMGAVCPDRFQDEYTNPSVNGALEAIRDVRMPLFRRKAFYDSNGSLDYCSDNPGKILRHISEHTAYDVDMILENLIRTTNLHDLRNWLNWNYVLPLNRQTSSEGMPKTAVVFPLFHSEHLLNCVRYLEAFPEGTDVYFTAETEELLEQAREKTDLLSRGYHAEYRLTDPRGGETSALLVACRDAILDGPYKLICYLHDWREPENPGPFRSVERDRAEAYLENMAGSEGYVQGIIEMFQHNPRLGLLAPPLPRNAKYYRAIGGAWTASEKEVTAFLTDRNISVPIEGSKPPLAAQDHCFWFRKEALRGLFEEKWEYSQFDLELAGPYKSLEKVLASSYEYYAQSRGFYSAVVMNSDYAGQEITRLTEISRTYVQMTLSAVKAKTSLDVATVQFKRVLQSAGSSVSRNKSDEATPKKSGFKRFVRGIMPIGLWTLLRRTKCKLTGSVYQEPTVERSKGKSIVRALTPRFIWNSLRKAKCRKNGWKYSED